MFRSGRLTRTRLHQIIGWVEKLPHNLKAVAKACNIYPSDLMAWYAAGQDPQCRDPLMAELAWRVAEIRGAKAAENFRRLETLAGEGHFQAIEKLESLTAESPWEISPDDQQAAELHQMMGALAPTPLLTAGVLVAGDTLPGVGPLTGGDDVGALGEVPQDLGVEREPVGDVDDDDVFHDQTLTPPE